MSSDDRRRAVMDGRSGEQERVIFAKWLDGRPLTP
jgi:hypothetical protein